MKTRRFTYRRALILGGFLIVNGILIYGISQMLAYLNTGADRSSLFQRDTPIEDYYAPEIDWVKIENPGRTMDVNIQKAIERDYLDAWYIKHLAFFENNTFILEDFYTQSARHTLSELIALNITESVHIESTSLTHSLELELLSSDGKLAILTDHNVHIHSRFFKENELVGTQQEKASFKVVLLLEDGFWRIRHLEKLDVKPSFKQSSPDTLRSVTKKIEGLNYYPKNHPWNTFTEDLSPSEIEVDFGMLKDLGLNSIRIFIGYEDFGKASVTPEKLDRLKDILDLAQTFDLQVIVTLFDFYGDYTLQDWSLTNSHARAIINHIKGHPALLAWDIKNEPDLDFESRGEALVEAWLQQTLSYVQQLDAVHPITIGWSHPDNALLLEKEVDLISFHYYEEIEYLTPYIESIKKDTDKPVYIQEIGMSTYSGLWDPFGFSEKDQEEYYTEFYKATSNEDIHYLFWTLHDFNKIPDQVAGKYPWRKRKQRSFGIIDVNDVPKPAYQVIKNR
ncbi:cellulase family glycosylhydrolase [Aureisphaera galaxeae]|uniref:cellulase family glycosylhydrolase n=1 Tax=Aureisphaera galaxeae TaxID=1538023 RepID=UPI00234FD6B3|nr:cellulase family glycosylhydrolase [Aureisphaera galaxeae]MDC8005686.1 cellulase family glycosylhydrolase [Aureisphaera galaxeae]